MSHGGYREGAGRKKTSRFTATVCWRVTPEAKDWLMRAASERGVPVGAVLEEMIKTFEEVGKGHIVMQKDFSKITVDFRSVEEGMSRPDLNGYVLSQPKEVLDDFIRRMEENPTMLGMIDRGDGTEDA